MSATESQTDGESELSGKEKLERVAEISDNVTIAPGASTEPEAEISDEERKSSTVAERVSVNRIEGEGSSASSGVEDITDNLDSDTDPLLGDEKEDSEDSEDEAGEDYDPVEKREVSARIGRERGEKPTRDNSRALSDSFGERNDSVGTAEVVQKKLKALDARSSVERVPWRYKDPEVTGDPEASVEELQEEALNDARRASDLSTGRRANKELAAEKTYESIGKSLTAINKQQQLGEISEDEAQDKIEELSGFEDRVAIDRKREQGSVKEMNNRAESMVWFTREEAGKPTWGNSPELESTSLESESFVDDADADAESSRDAGVDAAAESGAESSQTTSESPSTEREQVGLSEFADHKPADNPDLEPASNPVASADSDADSDADSESESSSGSIERGY